MYKKDCLRAHKNVGINGSVYCTQMSHNSDMDVMQTSTCCIAVVVSLFATQGFYSFSRSQL